MSEIRKEFESLPEVIDSLSCHIRIGSDGLYYTSLVNFEKLTAWLNGAWFAFQEQQAKIDELKNIIKMQECGVEAIKQTLNEIYNACDEDETVSMLLDKIQELLK